MYIPNKQESHKMNEANLDKHERRNRQFNNTWKFKCSRIDKKKIAAPKQIYKGIEDMGSPVKQSYPMSITHQC